MPTPFDPSIAIIGPGVPFRDPAQALEAGLQAADAVTVAAQRGVIPRDELADVQRWYDAYTEGRKFDELARAQYSIDRRYARGDSGFLVDANLIGTNIDILEAFLYARNPDFQITPGKAMKPPTVEALRDAVESTMEQDGSLQTVGLMAQQAAMQVGANPAQAQQAGEQAQLMMVESKVKAEVFKLRQRYARRTREIKAFCETCEIIGTRMWEDAKLKARGVPMVRSNLTIGVGIIKASWQERTESSPVTQKQRNDLIENLNQLQALKMQQEDNPSGVSVGVPSGNQDIQQDATKPYFPQTSDADARIAEIRQQIEALDNNVERVVERGYCIDNVQGENFQIPAGYTIANHLDAPWNADADYPTVQQALADHGDYLKKCGFNPVELLNGATKYAPKKPVMVTAVSASQLSAVTVTSEADEFVAQGTSGYSDTGQAIHVRRIEIWDRNANCVRTLIEGVKCWIKPIWNPPPTRRFYPYFLTCTSEVDGQRHPQSLVTRSVKLVDEYNRIGSDEAKHRRRIIPKVAFDKGEISNTEARKIESADIGEMVGIQTTSVGQDLRALLVPIAYPAMDPAVYDRTRITNELERIWGIQEALSGSKDYEQTATEAEIQQSGFNARTSSRRDNQDACFSDLALYTMEIARQYVTIEDAVEICGPDAFWPDYGGPEDIIYKVAVTVRAGSSGKPNTSRERESWGALLPVLREGIVQIGQLRGASPEEIADSLEEVVKLTAERSGEVIDVDALIPKGGGAMSAMGMQQGGAPGVPPVQGGVPSTPVGPAAAPDPQQQNPVPEGDPMAAENQPTSFA